MNGEVVDDYPLRAEQAYGSTPEECRRVDVLILGSAIGLGSVPYLLERARAIGFAPTIAVADAGPLDVLSHMAGMPGFARREFVAAPERVGGRLTLWGVSTPRPQADELARYPYEPAELGARFAAVEAELSVPDRIPMSGRSLEHAILGRLRSAFPDLTTRVAPLAINAEGRRYCPLDRLEEIVGRGVRLLPRFRAVELVREGGRISTVRGRWVDGRTYRLRPRIVVLAVGVEPSLPLIRPICRSPFAIQAADHVRIDLHGCLPPDGPFAGDPDRLGIAVLIMEGRGGEGGVPFHLEVKVAPKGLWARGYMQSSDNLRGHEDDATLYVQVQAVAAMHDRLPTSDPLRVVGPLSPVMSLRDARFHGELVERMSRVAAALGLDAPRFNFRPLLVNHHCYGAFRVGRDVTSGLRWRDAENLYILPPAAYVDLDDDANPTLKSLVLARYAMDDIARTLAESSVPGRASCSSLR